MIGHTKTGQCRHHKHLKKGGREGEKGKGREMGERVQNEYLKKKKEGVKSFVTGDNGDNGEVREGRGNRRRRCKQQQPRGQRAKAKQRLASDVQW